MKPSRPSRTALKIARTLLLLEREPVLGGVLPPGAAATAREVLAAADPGHPRVERLLAKRGFRMLAAALERVMLPGASLHVGLRKRYVDDQVRAAIAASARRVVVLGAGYDGLGLRLARAFPQVQVVEIDHPATHDARVRALPAPPANFSCFAVDLADAAGPGLLALETGVCTVFVAEGLLMYLDEAAVRRVFDQARRVAAPGSRFVFSFLGATADGRPDAGDRAWLMHATLSLIGEPFCWGVARERLAAFLAGSGWRLVEQWGDADLKVRYLPAGERGRPGLDWEFVGVAERG